MNFLKSGDRKNSLFSEEEMRLFEEKSNRNIMIMSNGDSHELTKIQRRRLREIGVMDKWDWTERARISKMHKKGMK